MIDVKKLFDELKEKKPYWSDIVIFNTCITWKKLSTKQISKSIRKLIDKNEYLWVNINELIEYAKKLVKQTTDIVSTNKN
jgi:hypothetical protein